MKQLILIGWATAVLATTATAATPPFADPLNVNVTNPSLNVNVTNPSVQVTNPSLNVNVIPSWTSASDFYRANLGITCFANCDNSDASVLTADVVLTSVRLQVEIFETPTIWGNYCLGTVSVADASNNQLATLNQTYLRMVGVSDTLLPLPNVYLSVGQKLVVNASNSIGAACSVHMQAFGTIAPTD